MIEVIVNFSLSIKINTNANKIDHEANKHCHVHSLSRYSETRVRVVRPEIQEPDP